MCEIDCSNIESKVYAVIFHQLGQHVAKRIDGINIVVVWDEGHDLTPEGKDKARFPGPVAVMRSR
jgi:hypothetical protein